jgi:hypothetical protein
MGIGKCEFIKKWTSSPFFLQDFALTCNIQAISIC